MCIGAAAKVPALTQLPGPRRDMPPLRWPVHPGSCVAPRRGIASGPRDASLKKKEKRNGKLESEHQTDGQGETKGKIKKGRKEVNPEMQGVLQVSKTKEQRASARSTTSELSKVALGQVDQPWKIGRRQKLGSK